MKLNIRQANATKSYVVTDVCSTRPRIAIKNGNNVSYLPLTTSSASGFGLRNKVNGSNYRPLEYQSMSTSATYYTSAVASNGLSSTTALTRSSTSQTVYHTCSSTSGTSYLTRSSTSGTSYLTKYGTDVTWSYTYSGVDSYMYAGSHTFSLHSVSTGVLKSSYEWTYSQWSAGGYVTRTQTYTITFNSSSTKINNTQYYYAITYLNRNVALSAGSWWKSNTQSNNTAYSSTNSYSATDTGVVYIYTDNYSRHSIGTYSTAQLSGMNVSWSSSYRSYSDYGYTYVNSYYTQGYAILTTGTSYLTRSSTSATSYLTRSSTSRTEYKTRASTSGYSGVSSSSSQSSGWL